MGRVKASARKMRFGAVPLDLGDQPLPEGERLGVRVVDPEDAHALVDPELHDALQLFPELAPLLGLEVEGVDVLVLLGRILGVLDRAIRAPAEPLRMLGDVGMIGSALEGDVQRQLEAVLLRRPPPGAGSRRACPARG